MARVTYFEATGEQHEIELLVGETVMQAAVRNGLKGIDGECGGVLACGTCQVYVQADWVNRVPPMEREERLMLEFASHVATNSRLSCRFKDSPQIDGLVVSLPESQR
jgi:ferredoxin, 2Fe-2S